MKYQEFIETVRDYVSSKLTDGQTVAIQPVMKNNGIFYDGLFIVDPTFNVSPTIYLNPYYHRYLSGVSLEDIYEDIMKTYTDNLPVRDFDVTVFTDFSKARERIVMKLINRRRNHELLKRVPFIPYQDLAIVFVCSVSDFIQEYATILIHHQHLRLWGISRDELYQIAMSNAPKLLPPILSDMGNLLEELAQQPIPFFDEVQMYVLTNQLKVHGAACMVYPQLLPSIAQKLDSNLYVIPSSIHEVLIVPEKALDGECGPQDFNDMIQEVNETQLTDDEVLGDKVYYFTRDRGFSDYPASK